MFTVPGWAVSATSLVAQDDPLSTSVSNHSSSRSTAYTASKKRKHVHGQADSVSKVSGSDLEKLWNQQKGLKANLAVKQPGKQKTIKPSASLSQDDVVPSTGDHHRNTTQKKPSKRIEHPHHEAIVKTSVKASDQDKSSQKEKRRENDAQKSGETNAEHRAKVKNVRRGSPPLSTNNDAHTKSSSAASDAKAKLPPGAPSTTKLTPLQAKMRNKLTSARFRHLNETLYTTTSSSALDLFSTSPDLFAEYHAGFSQQVKDSWPQNPVDLYVTAIKKRGALSHPQAEILPLPRKTGSCTIADLGCGDAPLARGCQSVVKTLKLKFHNFDLHSPNSHVTKADISNLPLRDGEADIAVFCLSLMGTNWVTFAEEAWRILRGDGKGEVWIAEVKSRFGRVGRGSGPKVVENSVGKRRKNQKPKGSNDDADADANGVPTESFVEESAQESKDETDISAFVKVFARRGFQLREGSVDKTNKMFVTMIFIKSGIPTAGKHKGLKWNGHEYQKLPEGKARFAGGQARGDNNDDDDISPEDEAKVLKPCVYKTR